MLLNNDIKINEVFFLTFFLVTVHLLQIYMVLPLELMARSDSDARIFSLIYLPHGAKTVVTMFFGIAGLVSIFISQFITSIVSKGYHDIALASSAISLTAFLIPWYLIGKITRPTDFESAFLTNKSLSAFWSYFTLGFGASLINGIGHHLLHNFYKKPDYMLMLKFTFGDMIGLFAFLFFLIAFRKTLKLVVLISNG